MIVKNSTFRESALDTCGVKEEGENDAVHSGINDRSQD
jgi:hypothetical protein